MTLPLFEETYSVSRLCEEVRSFLAEAFSSVWVVGEVQRLREGRPGHLYFELVEKDDADHVAGKLDAVLWRGDRWRVERALRGPRIEQRRVRLDVREHGLRADQRDRGRRGEEGEGRGEHVVAGLDPQRQETQPEGVRAGADGHAVRDAVVQRCFERGLLVLGCGENTVRFLPALNVERGHIDAAMEVVDGVLAGS